MRPFEQVTQRFLSALAIVNLARLRSGRLFPDELARLQQAAALLSRLPIFVDDTPSLQTMELRQRAKALQCRHGLSMVVVDYVQLMRSSRRVDSREQEVADISRTLKALAKDMNVPVLALAQLNRNTDVRENRRPMLSDLRESGAIEQDADVIMFLYRDGSTTRAPTTRAATLPRSSWASSATSAPAAPTWPSSSPRPCSCPCQSSHSTCRGKVSEQIKNRLLGDFFLPY